MKDHLLYILHYTFRDELRINRFEKTLIHLAFLFSVLSLGVK